ncbi:MAG: YlxR family protein [Clostridiales bacterium]|nr:YlxR family protein [Clostridiales bacterium]
MSATSQIRTMATANHASLPLRKCVACGARKIKEELLRVVKSASGEIVFDKESKLPGRGAYVCKNIVCVNKAAKSRGLQRSVKSAHTRSDDIYKRLALELDG